MPAEYATWVEEQKLVKNNEKPTVKPALPAMPPPTKHDNCITETETKPNNVLKNVKNKKRIQTRPPKIKPPCSDSEDE